MEAPFTKGPPPLRPPVLSADFIKSLCKDMPGLAEELDPRPAVPKDGKVNPKQEGNVEPNSAVTTHAAVLPGGSLNSRWAQGVMPVGMISGPKHGNGPEKIQPPKEIPAVNEMCKKFNIDKFVQEQLTRELNKRPKTYEDDIETIEEAMSAATVKSPAATLMSKIKELQQGHFVANPPFQRQITDMSNRYGLDYDAVTKLTGAVHQIARSAGKLALDHLETHLMRSDKPSALVMTKLVKIRNSEEVGVSSRPPSVGSLLWQRQEEEKQRQEEEKHRRRLEEKEGRGRDGQRDRGRGRSHGRDHDRRHDHDRREHDRREHDRRDPYAAHDRREHDRREHDHRREHDRGRSRSRDRGKPENRQQASKPENKQHTSIRAKEWDGGFERRSNRW